jgi:hypothetical protein
VAVGRGAYQAATGFAGGRDVLNFLLGLLHFVLQLFHFAHHAGEVECHDFSCQLSMSNKQWGN